MYVCYTNTFNRTMLCSSLSILSSTPASFPSACTDNSPPTSTSPSKFRASKRKPNFLKPVSPYNSRSKASSPSPILRVGVPSNLSVDDDGSADQFLHKNPRDDGSAEQFLQKNSMADFFRFRIGSADNGGVDAELQTAVVSYWKELPSSPSRPFLQVDLVSTIHVADREYYVTLQKELELYDCVLYEMLASREELEIRGNIAGARKLKDSDSRDKSIQDYSIFGYVQKLWARLLMLHYQGEYLDYYNERWYHADLDSETFDLLELQMDESCLTVATDMKLGTTEDTVQPGLNSEELGPWRSKLLWASRELPMPLFGRFAIWSVCSDVGSQVSKYPELEALSRLDFSAAMKVFLAKRKLLLSGVEDGDIEETSVILGERNKAAIEALRSAIDGGHNKIAILYGARHMPDLGRRLREELDLVPTRVQWLTAWSIRYRDLRSGSLSFLRKMAEISRWPLNGYQTLALLILPPVFALDFWLWGQFFCITAYWFYFFPLKMLQNAMSHGVTR